MSNPSGPSVEVASGMGFLVETGFFCVYTCLFIAALPALTSARRLKDARSANSAWVFLTFCILMYMVATAHLIFGGIRFYNSTYNSPNGTLAYLQSFDHFEFLGLIILVCIQTWLGDALVIYRCYFIWDNNLWLISIPVVLLLGTIGINLCVLYWFRHPSILAPVPSIHLLRSIYPLAFAQNFITTSLIILKIFLQHQTSKKAGVVNVGSKLGMLRIMRIIIESAAIYTIQIFVMNILYFRNNNFMLIVQSAIIPSIGITFILLALRIEASRNESATTKNDLGVRSSIIPQWIREPDVDIGPEDTQSSYSLAAVGGTEQKIAGKNHVESYNWDSEVVSSSERRPKVAASSLLSSDNGGSACTSKLPV